MFSGLLDPLRRNIAVRLGVWYALIFGLSSIALFTLAYYLLAAAVGSKDRDDGSFLVQVSGVGVAANAVVYSGILNEDVDGAPNCYGRFPFDAGIDRLKYATNLVGGGMFNVIIAVSIVSGKLSGRTETLTIYVEQQFLGFDLTGAYTASLVLAAIALLVLFAMQRLKPREGL
jgi:hypothetical protein